MAARIITLTTDFGTADHYVAAMKGVMATVSPTARVVDVTHEVEAYEITQGAYVVSEAWRWFPKKTVHVAVVDPGVGSSRRPILVEAGGHYFVGPDNGVFAMVYQPLEERGEKVVVREITAEKYFRHPVSRTFHGRDVFAAVAAHLTKGVPAARFGKRIEDYLKLHSFRPLRTSKRVWTGQVLHIDRFGNLITNFSVEEFAEINARPFEVAIGTEKLHRLALNYAEVEAGEAFVIVGSSGYLEVSVNQMNAAKRLGCGVGAPVELTLY